MIGGLVHMKMKKSVLSQEEKRNTCQRFSVEEYIAQKYGIKKENTDNLEYRTGNHEEIRLPNT